ncbi:fibronectin type III domain-containing protein, partial [Candidatus Venteria ishoeyi]|uniref:fibronectin type III domain-containing protein n=1 Tax=Candidatus Venteria ishoeyi TaxID=1899563 RepID=UPI0015B24698
MYQGLTYVIDGIKAETLGAHLLNYYRLATEHTSLLKNYADSGNTASCGDLNNSMFDATNKILCFGYNRAGGYNDYFRSTSHTNDSTLNELAYLRECTFLNDEEKRNCSVDLNPTGSQITKIQKMYAWANLFASIKALNILQIKRDIAAHAHLKMLIAGDFNLDMNCDVSNDGYAPATITCDATQALPNEVSIKEYHYEFPGDSTPVAIGVTAPGIRQANFPAAGVYDISLTIKTTEQDYTINKRITIKKPPVQAATTPPEPPKIKLEIEGEKAKLSWLDIFDAENYTLFYAPYSNPVTQETLDNIQSIPVGQQNFFSVAFDRGVSLYLAVQANNQMGTGNFSNVEALVIPDPVTVPPQAPEFRETKQRINRILMKWNAVDKAESYTLYVQEDGQTEQVLASGLSNTYYIHGNVKNGVTYRYRLTAQDINGLSSAYSVPVSETFNNAGEEPTLAPALSAPDNLTATPGDAEITLSWDAVSGAAAYRITHKTGTGKFGTTVASVPGTSHTLTGLTNGGSYVYKVAALDADGNSGDYSAEVSATPNVATSTEFN